VPADAGPAPAIRPRRSLKWSVSERSSCGKRAQRALEHVDRLRLAAERVERDRVLPREAVADLLALEFLGVLLVGR
jgi:hypothetical protein